MFSSSSAHTKKRKYLQAKSQANWWNTFKKMRLGSQISIFASLILILAGSLGLVLLQDTLLNQSQDIRQQAAIPDGQILISYELQNPLTFGTNTVDFFINTQSLQTDTISFVFEIWPQDSLGNASEISAITQSPDFQIATGIGLEATDQEVEQVGPGYLVATTIEANTNTPFSSNSKTQFATLTFEYLSSDYDTSQISYLPQVKITFDAEKSTAIVHGSNPPKDELRQMASTVFTAPTVPTVVDTDTQATTPSPTTTQTQTIQATSASKSTTVSTASCNEGCQNNHQCNAGLACYAGRCRNPLNLSDFNCAAPNITTTTSIAERCNQTCQTHRDCPANTLCHEQSKTCRLATNPASLTCSPATTKTVSHMYPTSTKGATYKDQEKNQEQEFAFVTIKEVIPRDTSEQKEPASSGSIIEDAQSQTKQDNDDSSATQPGSQENQIGGNINLFGYQLSAQLILGGLIGVGLLMLTVISLGLLQNRKSDRVGMARTTTISPEDIAAREQAAQEIKNKIAALQKVQEHTHKETTKIQMESADQPTPQPQNTMLARMKQKGVTPVFSKPTDSSTVSTTSQNSQVSEEKSKNNTQVATNSAMNNTQDNPNTKPPAETSNNS